MSNEPILCRKCGNEMQPNAVKMCVNCLSSAVDISEGLQTIYKLNCCPECGRYLKMPSTWIRARSESRELMRLCISQVRKPRGTRVVNEEFISTEQEPHACRRIKVKLVMEKRILNEAVVLQQDRTVKYIVREDRICESCIMDNPDLWVAVVQLRQNVSNRDSFVYLVQRMVTDEKSDYPVEHPVRHAVRIKQMDEGIDFFFGSLSESQSFIDYLRELTPIRNQSDKQLGLNSNYKRYACTVEICPICPGDLICLPPKHDVKIGNLELPVVICERVSRYISLLSPFSFWQYNLKGHDYWMEPFTSRLSSRQLVEYIVLDLDVLACESHANARIADIGNKDITFNVRTNLGRLLKPGDHVLGYDLDGTNINAKGRYASEDRVALVKKKYESDSFDEEKIIFTDTEYEQMFRDLVAISIYGN